jgi:hypothetical protein
MKREITEDMIKSYKGVGLVHFRNKLLPFFLLLLSFGQLSFPTVVWPREQTPIYMSLEEVA